MNNIAQLRYVLEVEKTGSISRAAERLYMGQPHLSRAIRELEEQVGITIFKRTPQGAVPTPEGEEFLSMAGDIVRQVDELELMYKEKLAKKRRFTVSSVRCEYVAGAFCEFLKEIAPNSDIGIEYMETNPVTVVKNVRDGVDNIGVLRYQKIDEQYVFQVLENRGLSHKPLLSFKCRALMHKDHPLAGKDVLDYEDLLPFARLTFGDAFIPAETQHKDRPLISGHSLGKTVSIYDRGNLYEILGSVPGTYMWTSRTSPESLERCGLVEKKCRVPHNDYRDVIIYRKGYKLKEFEKLFCDKLYEAAKKLEEK